MLPSGFLIDPVLSMFGFDYRVLFYFAFCFNQTQIQKRKSERAFLKFDKVSPWFPWGKISKGNCYTCKVLNLMHKWYSLIPWENFLFPFLFVHQLENIVQERLANTRRVFLSLFANCFIGLPSLCNMTFSQEKVSQKSGHEKHEILCNNNFLLVLV